MSYRKLSVPDDGPSPEHWPCERCQTWILPVKPPVKYRVWEVCFWVSVPVALFVLKGAGVVAMPLILFFVGGLAGPLHELATKEPRCPQCNCYLPAKRVLVKRTAE